MNRKITLIVFLLLGVLIVSGCFPGQQGPTVNSQDQAATQQAQIVQAVQSTATSAAMQTQIADLQTQVAGGAVVVTSTALPATAGPLPATPAPTATNTLVPPTATVPPTPIPPTAVPIIPTWTPSPTAIPCNLAAFVSDVSVPDGTVMAPGQTFVKTWRIKNVGACTWTNTYDLVFSKGNQMNGPVAVDFPGSVAPGAVIDLSVTLTAPTSEGSYRGYWLLRDSGGLVFGLGSSSSAFYADIKVQNVNVSLPFNFAANYCLAQWSSGAGALACPSPDNDSRGFVLRVDKPVLESGYVDDEAALVTFPQMVSDGVIRGKFPALRVESGYHFRSIIGCARGATKCNVKFQLDYQIGDGGILTLGTWNEVYDEKFTTLDVDLSPLAGKDVKFILTVLANGSYEQDRAQWLAPRIVK
jgi:hypothetical protein